MSKPNTTNIFWMVYIAFLMVLWPQAAWTIGQFHADTATIQIMGISAPPIAWALAGVVEATIGIVTHRLNLHWQNMPRFRDPSRAAKVFRYRWVNVYALALVVAMGISAAANYTHVVEFTNTDLVVFGSRPGAVALLQVLFGLALPGVSFVFARVLSTMEQTEQDEDPELAEANSKVKQANAAKREAEQRANAAEQRANEAEQRYRAVGDVIRYLFGGDDLAMRDRIRGIRDHFPDLSQNGIAQLVGCSTSTVNGALRDYEPTEMVEILTLGQEVVRE